MNKEITRKVVTREIYEYGGCQFPTEASAKHAKALDELKAFLEFHAVGRGGSWSQKMFLEFLTEEASSLISLLAQLSGSIVPIDPVLLEAIQDVIHKVRACENGQINFNVDFVERLEGYLACLALPQAKPQSGFSTESPSAEVNSPRPTPSFPVALLDTNTPIHSRQVEIYGWHSPKGFEFAGIRPGRKGEWTMPVTEFGRPDPWLVQCIADHHNSQISLVFRKIIP